MKKTYIIPKVTFIRIETTTMLAESIPKDGTADGNYEVESKKFNGGLGWEEDE